MRGIHRVVFLVAAFGVGWGEGGGRGRGTGPTKILMFSSRGRARVGPILLLKEF